MGNRRRHVEKKNNRYIKIAVRLLFEKICTSNHMISSAIWNK